ncbi:MAG: hypothetical protein KGL18_02295 [Burkholderiales bacterium]|nr:hypothetical protein [Burkholderiales bacterium]MDE1926636.1 hypothetical protein [Burkholderiales bacterium]MDE2159031.1 hypothetical protein [Burkholderiales bacterium]MDE2501798.1 hypothetical protein [Burkholderiales bacterium]
MLLALMVARRGQLVPTDIGILDREFAYTRLGVGRARFFELADRALTAIGAGACEHAWLDERARNYLNGLLESLVDMRHRRSICQLAATVLAADEVPGRDEALVYHHVLAHWQIDPAQRDGGSAAAAAEEPRPLRREAPPLAGTR